MLATASAPDTPPDAFARPSTPDALARPYLPTPPPSDRSKQDMSNGVGATTAADSARTSTRHPNGAHDGSPTKQREDRPRPLDLDAAIASTSTSTSASGSGSGFAQARGGRSPKPLDLVDFTVQPPSAGGGSGRAEHFQHLPPVQTPMSGGSNGGEPEYRPADGRRHSYQPMDSATADGNLTGTWPFAAGLAAPPTPGFAPKSPSAIHPSYGIPYEADEYADDPHRTYPLNGRSSPNDVENAHAYAGAPPMAAKLSRNGAPARPFYQPSLAEPTMAMPPTALARRLDSAPAWITYYFFANLALTLYNKFVLVSFPYAWSLTAVHTLCGAIGAKALLSRGAFVPARLGRAENLTLIAFSSLYTINIAVSNLSLNLVTVPFHQVVRAMTPLFTIAISAAFLTKRYNRRTFLALVPVVMGVGFATYGDYYFTAWGLILTLFGTFLAALKTVTTNIIMVGRLKLHPLDLLLRMSPLAFVQCVACAWYTGELDRVRVYGATQMTSGKAMGLVMNGSIAFLLNIVSFSANKKTNALTMTVAANVKQVLTILLAVVIFNLHVTGTNLIGIVLTLAGGAAYAAVEFQDKRRKTTPNLSLSSIAVGGGPGPLVLHEKHSPVPDNHEFVPPTVVR